MRYFLSSFLLLLPFFLNPWGDEPFFISKEWLLSLFILTGGILFLKGRYGVHRYIFYIIPLSLFSLISAILSDARLYSILRTISILSYFIYFVLLTDIFREEGFPSIIAFIFSLVSFINSLYAILQSFKIDPLFILVPPYTERDVDVLRIGGFMGGPIPLMSILTVTSPVSLSLALSRERTAFRLIGLLSYILSIYTGIITGKRISLFGIFVATIIIFLLYFKGLSKEKKWILPGAFFFLMLILTSFFLSSSLRRFSLYSLKEGFRDRFYIWVNTLRIIEKNPVFGTGPGTFKVEYFDEISRGREVSFLKGFLPEKSLYFQPHNIFLEVASDTGVAGLMGFIFLLFPFLREGVYTGKRDILSTGFFLSSLSFLIFSFFQPSLNFPAALLYALTSSAIFFAPSGYNKPLEGGSIRRFFQFIVMLISSLFFIYKTLQLASDTVKRNGKEHLISSIIRKEWSPSIRNSILMASERELKKAVMLSPWDGEGRYWLGYLYCITGRIEKCIGELEESKKTFRSAELHFNLASAYESAGKIEEAITNFLIAYNSMKLPQALERIKRHKNEFVELIPRYEMEGRFGKGVMERVLKDMEKL